MKCPYYIKRKAFTLPNRECLRWARTKDFRKCKNQWRFYRDWASPLFFNRKPQKKFHCITLGLWNSRSCQNVICADFDHLPPGFANWHCFFEYMRHIVRDSGLVFKSFTGKVKVFFVVKFQRYRRMTPEIAKETLSKLLPIDVLEYVDRSPNALSQTFLKPKQIVIIRKWLKTAPVHQACFLEKEHTYNLNYLATKQFEDILPKGKKKYLKFKKFMAILLAQKGLFQGFDLPITKLSKEVGCSPEAIRQMRSKLVKLGLLECIDDRYCKNRKARTYKAKGRLRRVLKYKYFNLEEEEYVNYSNDRVVLPKTIESGCWTDRLWAYSLHFIRRAREFISVGLRMKGVGQKKRWKKLFYAINARLKFFGKETVKMPRTLQAALRQYPIEVPYWAF